MSDHHQDHEFHLRLDIHLMLAGQDDREETAWFRHTKHQMIAVKNYGCWICNTRDHREVHHFHVERCLAPYVDWAAGSDLRADFPDFPWDQITSIYEFIDSEANCRVYCMEHHRGKKGSIHFEPHPMQNALRYMTVEHRNKYLEIPA